MNALNSKAAAVPPSAAEKNKQWQRELLMERIRRSHTSQHKTFPELSKAMRMSMLEKRYALDAVEKSNLQKCLDSMQHCIKVTSRQGLVERLESLSRQLGLKFMEDTSGLFISTDMFYLEIILDASGALSDVKVHHECKIEQQSCSELVNCLNRGDFADFTVQLEGLSSIYQLNAEPKVKTKAFVAMQAMETDLYKLYQMQNFSKDTQQILNESAVGVVLKRRGGHPMKLIYFVAPYDLISLESKTLHTLSIDLLMSKQIGMSVTVNLEAASANKLQILPTITFANDAQTGVEMPVYGPLTPMNSMLLPATFVLRLNKPMPVCYAGLRALGVSVGGTNSTAASGVDVGTTAASGLESQHKSPVVGSIMSLIVQTASEQVIKSSQKGLFVCLPDQTHCYFFTENKQLKASLITSVPYTEPAQVPKILEFLKKQALFYTLLSSCVRSQSKMGNDMDSTTILEVNAISFQQISVSLQHPYEESMATVEFDLRDGVVQCSIFTLSQSYDFLSVKLTKIVQKCHSIPVTIRALLKFWDQERMNMFQRSIAGVGGATTLGATGVGAGGSVSSSGGIVGGASGSNSIGGGTIKIEQNSRQQVQQQQQNAAMAAGAVAGFLKYKSDCKREDFHESPKSLTHVPNAASSVVEASSLGALNLQHHTQQQQTQQQQHHLQQPQNNITTAKSSEFEIADKYKNIWKDKTPNLKNCVSITPISNETINMQANMDVKRSGGIEIIPLTAQGSNGAANACVTASPNPQSVASVGSSTITITPINASPPNCASGSKDKKSISSSPVTSSSMSSVSAAGAVTSSSSAGSSNASVSKRTLEAAGIGSNEGQKEKKRKKKRDDSPMGPPEKVYSRQNSPAAMGDAATTAVVRKFPSPSSSPKGSSGGMMVGSAVGSSSLSTRPSPKHSPVYGSSPKHNTASNSPKSPFGTHSPKHGSSGKPSMSTLKSAAATSLSLSPKGDKSGSSCLAGAAGSAATALARSLSNSASGSNSGQSLAGVVGGNVGAISAASSAMAAIGKNRDKEKTTMSAANAHSMSVAAGIASANLKTNLNAAATSVAMQQLKAMSSLNHLNPAGNLSGGFSGASVGVSSLELNTAAAMRKAAVGVTGAVSLMTSTATMAAAAAAATTTTAALTQQQTPQLPLQQPAHGSSESSKMQTHTNASNNNSSSNKTITPTQSSEYMVKSSQEGLKLTINKTSGRSASTTKVKHNSSSSASTKKQHTGLKPGVNSGPASKKSSTAGNTSSPTSTLNINNTSSSSSSAAAKNSTSQSAKHVFQKSNSSGSLSTKISTSTMSGLVKSNSTNSFGADIAMQRKSNHLSSSSNKKSSSTAQAATPPTRLDHNVDMLKILQYASPTMAANMEGFMKGFSTKFQIPKLSQRAANTTTSTTTTTATTNSTTSTSDMSARASVNFSNVDGNTKVANKTYNQQQFATSSDVQKLKEKNLTGLAARSPPPPYHIAVASNTSAAAATATTTVNNNAAQQTLCSLPPAVQAQSTVSVHLLKSPAATAINHSSKTENATAAAVAVAELQSQHQHSLQHQVIDYLKNSADEKFTTAAASLAGK